MNEIVTKVKIVKTSKLEEIYRGENWITVANMGEYSLVRHQGPLDRELLKLLEPTKSKPSLGFEPKMRGLVSSVPLSAAVTGYARMALSQYINLEGNECVYSDTDSVVLTNKLPSNMVGPEIGNLIFISEFLILFLFGLPWIIAFIVMLFRHWKRDHFN